MQIDNKKRSTEKHHPAQSYRDNINDKVTKKPSEDVLVLNISNPFRANSKDRQQQNKRSEIKISKSQMDLSAQKAYEYDQQDLGVSGFREHRANNLSSQKSVKGFQSGSKDQQMARTNSKHRLSTGCLQQQNICQSVQQQRRKSHANLNNNDEIQLNVLNDASQMTNRMSLDDIIQLAIDKSKQQLQVNQGSYQGRNENRHPIQDFTTLNSENSCNIYESQKNLPQYQQNQIYQSIQQQANQNQQPFNPLLTNIQSVASSYQQFNMPYHSQQEFQQQQQLNQQSNNMFQGKELEDKITELVEKCLQQKSTSASTPTVIKTSQSTEQFSYPPLQMPNKHQNHYSQANLPQQLQRQQSIVSQSSAQVSSNEFIDFKQTTEDINKKMKDMQKALDNMNFQLNDKEAEVIRLNLCLEDERKRNEYQSQQTTPKRQRSGSHSRLSTAAGGTTQSYLQYQNTSSNDVVVRNMMKIIDSPYFKDQQNNNNISIIQNLQNDTAHSSRTNSVKNMHSDFSQSQMPKKPPVIKCDNQMQTEMPYPQDLSKKVKKYENMLKSESQANEELSDRIQELEQSLFKVKQEKDQVVKQNKELTNQKDSMELKISEFQVQQRNSSQQSEEHIMTLKKQLEKLQKENLVLKRQQEDLGTCNACIDYIKQMKSYQFKLEDMSNDKDNQCLQIKELKNMLDNKDEELREMSDKVERLESQMQQQMNANYMTLNGQQQHQNQEQVAFNLSFHEKEIELMKDLEISKKQNYMNERVIEQLKKELEKYAYKLFQIEEKSKQLQLVQEQKPGRYYQQQSNYSNISELPNEEDDEGWQ
eukprot:403377479